MAKFNNISLDRAGTQISDLPGFTSSLSSVKTGNKTIFNQVQKVLLVELIFLI
jgi:hypothetical protein